MSYERMLGMGTNGQAITPIVPSRRERPPITPEEARERAEREAILEGRIEFKQWLDSIFPRTMFFWPPRVYVENAARTFGIPDTGDNWLLSVGMTAVPLLAGYWTYKKTDGSIPWIAAASVGSLYASSALVLVYALGSLGRH